METDGFRPELDAYLVWMVEWSNEVHIGKSIWLGTEVISHIIEIGEVHVRP
ncbi:hypothetical protein [Wolbachia endosymbiont (group A) of Myopa testacea]|uniref:hypothetical protein n=1 Tax=Wolbachia endosymbiont (group A) of Myopa testacea TaxID=3066148 RepID=UPI0033419A4E